MTKTRNEVVYALRQENVGTLFHFYGLHLHEYYCENLGCRQEDTPHATAVLHEVLSLPLHPDMSDQQGHEVTEAVKKDLLHVRK